MHRSDDRLEAGNEFVAEFQSAFSDGRDWSDMTATVAMIQRTYETRWQTRTHLALGTVAVGQTWRFLKHSLAITTVNLPFTMNYRAQAIIKPTKKLTLPYSHLPQIDVYVGTENVRDHVWEMSDELLESNRVGVTPFPILLDHFESMISQAKETGWDVV